MAAFLFGYEPRYRAISATGAPIPGAILRFSVSPGTTPTDPYSDSTLTTPVSTMQGPGSAEADSGGLFPAIFLSSEVVYRVRLFTSAGVLVWDQIDYSQSNDLTQSEFNTYYALTDDHKRTAAEIAAGVTPTNYAYLPPSAARYGFDTAASGATNRAAVVACLAANWEAYLPAGTYPWAGAVLTMAGEQKVYGDSDVLQNPTTILQRSSGDYLGYFDTDSTTSAFTGIYIANIKVTGGSSATWSDVQGKWLVESHLPFTRIKNLHIEDGANFWGNGVRLHNDDSSTNGGSMGAWGSDIEGLRFVGTTSTPADNSAIGLDMKINGGWVTVRRSSMQRFNTGAWVRSGENISFDDVDIEEIRAGGSADRDNAALIIGEANSSSRVKGFSFKGYIEGAGRAILAQNVDGMKVFGSYLNAVRSFSPSGGSDGFIYLNKTCHGVVIEGNSIESQYNLPAVIYSETPYVTSGNKLFINCTNSSYVPQPYYGGGIFEGTRPSSNGDTTIYLSDAATSAAISGVAASGSLVEITKSSHGLSTGRFVWVEGIVGTVGDVVNGRLWRITSTGANTFTLDGSLHSGSYTSGGNYWLPTVKTGDESGSFTATLTGCTTSPTASVTWSRAGRVVSMVIPSLTATSNTTACTLTGLPDELMPLVVKRVVCRAVDNGTAAFSMANMDPATPGTIALGYGVANGVFTGSGTKGSSVTEITYSLD